MNAGLEECQKLRKDHVDISGQLSLQSRFGFFSGSDDICKRI